METLAVETIQDVAKILEDQVHAIELSLGSVTDVGEAEDLLVAKTTAMQKLEAIAVCLRNRQMAQQVRVDTETRAQRASALRERQAALTEELNALEQEQRAWIRQAEVENPELARAGVLWSLSGSHKYTNTRADLERRLVDVERQLAELEEVRV